MRRFTRLFVELDRAKGTRAKLDALVRYFEEADPADAAHAVRFLAGGKVKRLASGTELRALVAEEAGLPVWLVEECHDAAGDLAEALALLLPTGACGPPIALRTLVEDHTVPLRRMTPEQRGRAIVETWSRLDGPERLVWNKLMLGAFRVGVARRNLTRALAEVAGVEPAVMAHRMTGAWEPTAARYRALIEGAGDDEDDAGRPYPFFLAHAIEEAAEPLGERDAWQAEWKYDGIRAQLIRREHVVLWSRGEELIGETFPEIAAAGARLPAGTVLDGEIVAWENDAPLPFSLLQRRLNRKRVEPVLFDDVPVAFLAFDLLEQDGADVRARPLDERRAALERVLVAVADPVLLAAPRVEAADWAELERVRAESRERGVEGLMIKRRAAPYGTGRTRGDGWKWKVDPHTVDTVLIAAERGRGRRAGLYTAFTFGVWDGDRLVPVTRAYSGLTDEEFEEVNRFIHANTTGRHGPVRTLRPHLVFEIAFDRLQASSRHQGGIALRFPRMQRWRRDKRPEDADGLSVLQALLAAQEERETRS
jgi:DNA ligase-1